MERVSRSWNKGTAIQMAVRRTCGQNGCREMGLHNHNMGPEDRKNQNGRREMGLYNHDMGYEDRKKGSPRHRWAQLFKAAVGPEWTRIARNREI